MRADGANTASSIAPSSLAGATSMSSTTTSAAPAAASRAPASSGCSQRSATAVSALCSRSRRRVLPVMPRLAYADRVLWISRHAHRRRGRSIDAAISNEVLRVLKPLGIEAALKAIEAQSSTTTAAERQLELSLQQARYEAAHARRQYDAVDPANRLVAGELERRWNEA